MDLPRLISLSGKKNCGKSFLSNICVKLGYTKLSFATNLKLLICDLLGISLVYLNNNKDIPFNYKLKINKDKFCIIYNKTNIPLHIIENSLLNKTFTTYREILQFIGTDLIRNHNSNWHIDNIKDIIYKNPDVKFCLDDTRFLNELNLIKELNGLTFYIKTYKNINDLHISENEMSPENCNYILINKFNNDIVTDFLKIIYTQ